jgi:hypothetical protein
MENDFVYSRVRLLLEVGDLDRLALCQSLRDVYIIKSDVLL